jgi:hypothetical protein
MLSSSLKCDQIFCAPFVRINCLIKPTSEAKWLKKRSCLAPALGVTKYTNIGGMILVTICYATQVRFGCSTNPLLRLVCLTKAHAKLQL